MIFEQFSKIGVVPVLIPENFKEALNAAKILFENDLPCVEVVFDAPAAEESIKIIGREFPDILIGASRILTIEQADRAMNAGAKFIAASGLNPKIVQYCLDESVPVIPGALTPTELEQVLELGLKVVRFFPAELSGGLGMIKAMAEAYSELEFMPVGGINAKNLSGYLSYQKVIACAGSWLIDKKLMAAEEWEKISALVKEAASIVKNIRS